MKHSRIALLAAFGAFLCGPAVMASPNGQVDVGHPPSVGEDLNARYVKLDRSPAGLAAYAAGVRRLQEELAARDLSVVHSTITLSAPQNAASVADLLDTWRVEPRLIYALALGEDGNVVTIAGRLRRGLQQIPEVAAMENLEFLGIVAVIGAVPTDGVASLQDDDRVFLVDVSADEHLADNPENKDYMQHFGLDLYLESMTKADR